ncbi:MAG: dihydrolipoyl dehydrogenase [Chlamydiia bacterium]|nr:dihydrolipoyl dehydrogenase [Chlamydiia bacterium]
MKRRFDVVVLGAGPGGYPAAIKAAQYGKSAALVEVGDVGGTCLNRGCIPSKALIANAEMVLKFLKAEELGIQTGELTIDYLQMANRKDRVVGKIRKGLKGLIEANGIELIKGFGKFIGPNTIKITGETEEVIEAESVVIATGSEPREISAFPFDHERVLDSTDLLALKELPKRLAIIGGGIIGCEFASLHAALGVEVTILEMLPKIIPMECDEVSDALTKAFEKRGISLRCGVKVAGITHTKKGVKVETDGEPVEADMALVAVGRTMNTDKIGLDKIGLKPLPNGLLEVNERMETVVPGVYAIGDIASTWWLAHVATHQGLVAAANIAGKEMKMHMNAIPSVIYTHPEIATVGLSLARAKEKGYHAAVGAFPFQALGKSQAIHETEGFAQIVIDKETGQILGAQVVGYESSSLIAEMAVAVANELTVACLTDTIHAHPSAPEAWMEAAFLAEGMPLHFPPKKGK